MSANLLRDARKAFKNGVNLNHAAPCEADIGGSGRPVSVYLRSFGVRNMDSICKSTGHGPDYFKRLYRDRELDKLKELIDLHNKITGDK